MEFSWVAREKKISQNSLLPAVGGSDFDLEGRKLISGFE